MKLFLYSIGKEGADAGSVMVSDYQKRLKKYCPLTDHVFKPGSEKKIYERIKSDKHACVVAMDERGKQFSSIEFASKFKNWMNNSTKSVIFVIGGAEGLAPEIRELAHETIALSKMTLPHRFARLFLTEQIYRAFCILNNTPYHK